MVVSRLNSHKTCTDLVFVLVVNIDDKLVAPF